MGKYTKKPVEIEAFQFIQTDEVDVETIGLELASWCGGSFNLGNPYVTKDHPERSTHILIPTLEGDMIASYGDWIIKGVNGEFYPCKPDIFKKMYNASEPAEIPPEGRYATVYYTDAAPLEVKELIGRAEVVDGKIVIEPVNAGRGKDLWFNIHNDRLIEIRIQSTTWRRKGV